MATQRWIAVSVVYTIEKENNSNWKGFLVPNPQGPKLKSDIQDVRQQKRESEHFVLVPPIMLPKPRHIWYIPTVRARDRFKLNFIFLSIELPIGHRWLQRVSQFRRDCEARGVAILESVVGRESRLSKGFTGTEIGVFWPNIVMSVCS